MTLLYQPQKGYCYNSDTLVLVNFIKENLKIFKNNSGELLDIGSGSGVLGILIAKLFPKMQLNCAELQEEFIFLTKKNTQINGLEVRLYEGNFEETTFDKQFDMIISNPPFYPSSVVQSEDKILKAARYNDSLPLEVLIEKTSKILKENGKFFFCYDVKLLDDIIFFCKKYRLNIESMQFLHPKIDRKSSLVMVFARKNSKSHLSILPPLIMFDGEKFTKEMEEIYTMCNTYSIKVDTKQL